MSNYIMHNGQLHNADELMHWKYVKRVRKNGKWVYYYDRSQLREDVGITKVNDVILTERRRKGAVQDQLNSAGKSKADFERYGKKADKLGDIRSKEIKEYLNTPLGKLDKKVLSKFQKNGELWLWRKVRKNKFV